MAAKQIDQTKKTIILDSIPIINDAEIKEELKRKIFLMIHSGGMWSCKEYKTGLKQNEYDSIFASQYDAKKAKK